MYGILLCCARAVSPVFQITFKGRVSTRSFEGPIDVGLADGSVFLFVVFSNLVFILQRVSCSFVPPPRRPVPLY